MDKRQLFEVFLDRMSAAQDAGMPFESAWYAYAVLEDRLVSMLRNSGGETSANGKEIRMMGNKITMLRKRAANDALLAANFPEHDVADVKATRLWIWKDKRDTLMHSMADGNLTLGQIDAMVDEVSVEGALLAREYASAAMRLKKHRSKVSSS